MTAPAARGALRSDATAAEAVRRLLGPEEGSSTAVRRYAALPSPRRPRYLLPTAGRSGAGAHLRPGAGPKAAAGRWALRTALRAGAARALPGSLVVDDGSAAHPGLRRHLAEVVGRDEVELAVALGAPRPNRKPVIQVLTPDGTTLAWAKLGVDAHTDALVAHESDALRVPRAAPLVVPEVLGAGTWQGHRLLVLAHMPMTETAGDLRLTPALLRAIAGEVTTGPAAAGTWWTALRADAAAGVDPTGAVARRLDVLAQRLGDRTWPFGRWHGDLAPWNATWEGDVAKVWDWERAGGPVPLGLDAVHDHIQVAVLRDDTALPAAVAAAPAAVGDLLVALGHDPDDVELVIAAYLATLRVRYAGDAHLGSLGPGTALAAALDAEVTAPDQERP